MRHLNIMTQSTFNRTVALTLLVACVVAMLPVVLATVLVLLLIDRLA